eukprot:TRINITY_DN795_c0_g1_i1.p1 TRINITY_DN795_c0_g1~~TRINITY_DN795_c0_g1_i1.p1  ORF type:complete len:463 (-),score=200.17 TRINITY_DN795_c0_g1_i1:35-1342(-)
MRLILTISCLVVLSMLYSDSVATSLPPYCSFTPQQGPTKIPQPNIDPSQKPQLQMVVTVIRHGDRIVSADSICWPDDTAVYNCSLNAVGVPTTLAASTTQQTVDSPSVVYSSSFLPGRNFYKGNCNVGQLTLKGSSQEVANGNMLRGVYVKPPVGTKNPNVTQFLPQNYSASAIYMRSDYEGRTIQSAQSLMLGLYPPSNEAMPKGKTQIRNLVSMDPYYDDIEPNYHLCPILADYIKKYTTTPEYTSVYNSQIVPLMASLETYLKRPVKTMSDIRHLFDCFNVHLCHNFPIPVPMSIYQDVVDAYTWDKKMEYNYPTPQKFAQAGMGFLLEEIATFLKAPIFGNQTTQFALISGHDTTLAPILVALGVWDGVWTPYASMINFELYKYQTSGKFYVRVLYNGSEIKLPAPCSAVLCPSDVFFNQFLGPILPTTCV